MKLILLFFALSLVKQTDANFVCPIGSDQKPINGAFRDPALCSVYYQCVGGVAYPQQCPPGLHFKIVINDCQYFACVQPTESGCSSKKEQVNKSNLPKDSLLKNILNGKAISVKANECLPNLNSTVPSSTNPTIYYNCINGYGWIQQCPPQTKFNPAFDYEKCNNEICRASSSGPQPIHGGWSQWSDWGNCNSSCGAGTRTRTRICNNPPPSNGGRDCEGQSTEIELCDNGPCPIVENPAFMVSLKESTRLEKGYFNWTMINLNSGGMFKPETNSISISKPGLYFFSMVITCAKSKPIDTIMERAGRNVGIQREVIPSLGPETLSRTGLFVLSNLYKPVVRSRIQTDVYSSEEGKETSWLGFYYDTDNYLFCGSIKRITTSKIAWPIISAMKGFTEKSDRTEFRASTGGWYLVSMGMKSGYSGTGIIDSTKLTLEISRNNAVQQTHKVLEVTIRKETVRDQFSRSFLIFINSGDVFITRSDGRSRALYSGYHFETYLSAFRLNSSLPHFMASRRLQTCDEFINIAFPDVIVDSTKSWDEKKHQYLVKKSGRYYIEYSFEPRTDRTLDVRMYLNGNMIAVTKKQNRHDRGYILTRSILLDLKENDVLYWKNYGCLNMYLNPSTLTIIYTS